MLTIGFGGGRANRQFVWEEGQNHCLRPSVTASPRADQVPPEKR